MNGHHEQNPSLKHADLLGSVCSPLQAHEVSFFGYTAVDPLHNAYCLGSKAEYAGAYLQKALAEKDVHNFEFQSKSSKQYFFWDFCELDKETEALYQIAHEFDQNHTLTITHTSKNLIQCYHFSGQNHNERLNQYYLEHLDALHLFIDYFDECLHTLPELTELFQNPISIHKKAGIYRPASFIGRTPALVDIAQYKTPLILTKANQFLLTKQERECLRWIHKGKPYELIAELMGISRKTVERYVTAIKEKYQCYTLFQLGQKMSENQLSHLLAPTANIHRCQ